MTTSAIYTSILILFLLVACNTTQKKFNTRAPDRVCDCFKLLTRQEHGFYVSYLDGEDTLYTGKCTLTRENGNTITYAYLKGHPVEEIECYPGGILNEELYFDTTGHITKRVRYFTNGHIAYKRMYGDHGYETFYEDGRIERKGGFTTDTSNYKPGDATFYKDILFDSIWKPNGEFDSVYHYSPASVHY